MNPILAQTLLVECAHCWAAVGERCYVTTGRRDRYTKVPHAVRIRATARHLAGLKNDPIGRKS